MFLIVKWYLDLVTDDGTALIAYAARLRWRGARVDYASILVSPASGKVREVSTVGRIEEPHVDGDVLTWEDARLRVSGRWQRLSPPIRRQLFCGPDGGIMWACEMPRARAIVQVGADTFEGFGYAECLSLSIPPWKLPFHTLRWGRHTSALESVVWIDWVGDDTRHVVWLDGVEQRDARVTDSGVSGLDGDVTLAWRAARDVCHACVLARLNGSLVKLAPRLADPLAAMLEHKQLARSTIERGCDVGDRGWTLFETVTW